MSSDVLIRGGEQSPSILIDKSFIDSRPYQTYLEAYRNVEQAIERDRDGERYYWDMYEAGDRNKVRFVIDVHQIENDALKMLIWNTAPPMSEEEMRKYFTKVGQSHEGAVQYGSKSRDGQLGQGFRQGTLPWNTYGMVAISCDPWDEEEPNKMMWMHKQPYGGPDGPLLYSIRPLPAYVDQFGSVVDDIVVPVQEVDGIDFDSMIPDEVRNYGGMVFVMLGDSPEDNTYNGAKIKKENGAGIYRFLNNSTIDGSIATVTFATTESAAGGGRRFEVNGKTIRFDRRRVKAYDEWTIGRITEDGDPAIITSGEITNPETGVTYKWVCGPLNLKQSRHDVYNGMGYLVAPYKTDLHPIMPSASKAEAAFAFGMLAKTANVVGIQVVLPVRTTDEQEGLYVEQSLDRSRLILSTGESLPWRDIGRWFADNLPEPIVRLNAEVDAMSERKTFNLDRFKRRIKGYLSGMKTSKVLVEEEDGNENGEDLGHNSRSTEHDKDKNKGRTKCGPRKGKNEISPKPTGAKLGRLRHQADLPEVRWCTKTEWAEVVGESDQYVAVYRQGPKAVLYFAVEHDIIEHLVSVITSELESDIGLILGATYDREDVMDRIKHHMTCDVLGSISHVEKSYSADPDARDTLLSPTVLTARAAGFDSIVELVKQEIVILKSPTGLRRAV